MLAETLPAAAPRTDASARPASSSWPEWLGLVLLLVAAAGLRALRWQGTSLMFNDGPAFLMLAKSLGEGRFADALAHPYHPLYPFLVLVTHFWVGDWERAAVLVSAIAGAASVLCLWLFVRASLGRRAAWIAAVFLAVQPNAIEDSADIQSDGLYLALFLAGVLFLWWALRERRAALAGWSGIFAGLAYLARPEGLGIVAIGAGLFALYALLGRWRLSGASRCIAALVAASLLMALPYLTLLRVQNGSWTLTQKKSTARLLGFAEGGPAELLWGPLRPLRPAPAPDRANAEPAAPAAAPSETATAPSETAPAPREAAAAPHGPAAGLLRATLAVLFSALRAVRPWFLALVLAGVWMRRGRAGPLGEVVLAFLAFYGVVLLMQAYHYGYAGTRHALPPMVLTFGYFALAVPVLGSLLLWPIERVRGAHASPRLAAGAGLALVVVIALGQALRPERPGTRAERAAAQWLATSVGTPGAVAAPKVRIAYYARRAHVSLYALPRGDALVGSLRQQGARYVILEEKKLSEFPEIGAAAGGALRVVHVEEDRGRRALVYELSDAGAAAAAAPSSPEGR